MQVNGITWHGSVVDEDGFAAMRTLVTVNGAAEPAEWAARPACRRRGSRAGAPAR